MGSVGAALGGDASILAFWIRALLLAALFVYPLSRIISLLVRKYATRSGYWNQVLKVGEIKLKDLDMEGTGWKSLEEVTTIIFSYMCWVSSLHTFGGLLCLPRVLSLGSLQVQLALAAYGVSIELAWEVVDTIQRVCDYLKPGGEKRQPPSQLLIIICHHSLTIGASIYFEKYNFVFLCFVLQFFAGLSIIADLYCQTLDVATQQGLRRMYWMTFFTFFILIVGRFVIAYTVFVQLAITAVKNHNWVTFGLGTFICFIVFSGAVFLIVLEAFGKFKKYHTMYWKGGGDSDAAISLGQVEYHQVDDEV